MTTEIAVVAGGIIGAVLCFTAGWFLSKWAKSVASGSPSARPSSSLDEQAQMQALAQERDMAVQRSRHLEIAVNQMKSKTKDHLLTVHRQLAKVNDQFNQANQRMVELQKTRYILMRDLDTARLNKLRLSNKHERTQDAYHEMQIACREMESDLSRLQEEVDQVASDPMDFTTHVARDENEKLRDEKANLSQSLQKAQLDLERMADLTRELESVKGRNQDLLIKNKSLAAQLEVLEALREENRLLRSQVDATQTLQGALDELKAENVRLKSMGIILEGPPTQHLAGENVSQGLGQSLEAITNRLSETKESRGSVLADELGLLVAGTGDRKDAMAGMAALFATIGQTMTSLMSFGEIDYIRIANMQGLNLTMQPLSIDQNALILTTLTLGAGPTRETVKGLIEELTP